MPKITNTDLSERMELFEKRIGSRVNAIGKIAMDTQKIVGELTTWRATESAAKLAAEQAVENYIRNHPEQSGSPINKEVLKALTLALSIISVLAGAIVFIIKGSS